MARTMPPVLRDGKGFHGAGGPGRLRAFVGLSPVPVRGRGGLDLATIGRQCRAMPNDSRTGRAKGPGRGPGSTEREQRLAAALRENLRKRKAQRRERLDSQAPDSHTEKAGGGGRPDRD